VHDVPAVGRQEVHVGGVEVDGVDGDERGTGRAQPVQPGERRGAVCGEAREVAE
jgi:hypothetical protein